MTDSSVYIGGQVDSISTNLLNGVRQGDQAAWQRLVEIYLPLVYWWCKRKGLQEADILDIGQDVLVAVAKNLDSFRRDRSKGTFRGWLRRITENAIRDHFRGKQKQVSGTGGSDARELMDTIPDPAIDASDVSQATEVQILYSRMVELVRGEFSEQDWQAIHRVFVENQRPADVAEDMGITRNQVYLAVSRVRKRLREEFGEEFDGKVT